MARTGNPGINPVQKDYLDILRSAIWGEKSPFLPEDIEGVMQIANLHKTRPLILDALQKAGYEVVDSKAWDIIYRTASSHITLNRTIANLVRFFREAGVDCVLLKGQGVAKNYPQPMLRECGDIDLYVGAVQYQKSCELLKSLATESNIEAGSEQEKHYHIRIKGVDIELHRYCDTIQNRRQNTYFQAFAKKGLSQDLVPVSINDFSVNTPADTFNAFYLFFHIWHHFIFEGVGLRQICDWTLFLHSRAGKIDSSVIENALKKLHLQKIWQIFASIAVDYLGLPSSEMPCYKAGQEKKSYKYLTLILQDGNFGQIHSDMSKRPSSIIAGKLFTIKQILKRPRRLYHLFPEIRPMIASYSIGEVKAGLKRTKKEFLDK